MATHIDSISSSSIAKVSRSDFYSALKPGIPIFCQGNYKISVGIEKFTGSPFSHVATVIYIDSIKSWAVLEATKEHGVHLGHLEYYTDTYNGDIVLADTPSLKQDDYSKLLLEQFTLIDDNYDTEQEAEMVAHKLIAAVPVKATNNEYFCSGLYEQGRRMTSIPLVYKGEGMANPEQVWTDPSIVPLCALIK